MSKQLYPVNSTLSTNHARLTILTQPVSIYISLQFTKIYKEDAVNLVLITTECRERERLCNRTCKAAFNCNILWIRRTRHQDATPLQYYSVMLIIASRLEKHLIRCKTYILEIRIGFLEGRSGIPRLLKCMMGKLIYIKVTIVTVH